MHSLLPLYMYIRLKMGYRKFRLGVHRKNSWRKKCNKPKSLVVSIEIPPVVIIFVMYDACMVMLCVLVSCTIIEFSNSR